MNSLFSISDFKNALPKIGKNHPFLPDRDWIIEEKDDDMEEKLSQLLIQINQNGCTFESMEAYFEWQEKPTPAIKMSTPDWLVHFAIFEKIEDAIQKYMVPNTACQVSKIDNLIAQCKLWKKEDSNNWILQTDIKSFFKNIQHEILIENLQKIIPQKQLIDFLKQYLHASENAMKNLETKSPNLFGHKPKTGLPIGAELNYLLTSAYLLSMDTAIFNSKEVLHYARYIDDILVFVKEGKEVELIQELVQNKLEDLGLELNFSKTSVQNSNETIYFLKQEI